MSRAGKGKTRSYWGCTVFGCERGFNGTEEAFPEDVTHCPACGDPLSQITVTKKTPDPPVPVAPPVDPAVAAEMLAQHERHARAERMFQLCRGRIVEHYPSLWPGEVRGLAIGAAWIRNVELRLMQQRAAAQRSRLADAAVIAAAGRALPS